MNSKHKVFLPFFNIATKDQKKMEKDALNRPMIKLKGERMLKRIEVNKIITFVPIILL
jgi:hypothetical protein